MVYVWGNDHFGQLGVGCEGTIHKMPKICTFGTEVSQVSCGEDHTVVVCLKNMENNVYAMGSNANGKLGIGAS